jgi:serine/threonine-protein kinase RsbW
VALAREALAGLAETISLSREQYDDVRTAVTEACNNVVQHAYSDGGDGPMEMEIRVLADAVEVVVRDEGIGLGHVAAQGGGELEIGLPVILALAERVELGHPPDGGTEVQMRFRTPGIAAPAHAGGPAAPASSVAAMPGGEQAVEDRIVLPQFKPEVTLLLPSARLAGSILPRVAAALAARAHFSTDRVSDVQMLSDSIAADAFRVLDGAHLQLGLSAAARRLTMQVGPLLRGGSERIGLLARLADRQSVTAIGPAEVLVVSLDDRA